MSQPLPLQALDQETLRRAEQAVQQACWVPGEVAIDGMAATWQETHALGIDTEFVRERTFFPRPGLIQVSDGETVWLLDPLDQAVADPLRQALDSANTPKILHSVGEDLEVLELVAGTLPSRLFDTQIAAAMLGQPLQMRYEHLVKQCFDVDLAGGQARSDWCQRPLSTALLTYAAQDVIWLPRLHAMLGEELDRMNRLAWLEEDCDRLLQRAARAGRDTSALARVKGAARLDDDKLACLGTLADWRESEARRRDLPRSFIIKDDALLELANAAPDGHRVDAAIKRLPPPVQRRYSQHLRDCLDKPPAAGFQRPSELQVLDREQQAIVKQLQQGVKKVAEEVELDPALIASRRELTRLLRGEQPDWLSGWRGDLLKPVLSEILGSV
ncbi:MAG: ribonuclease D [Wenzhouxiangella sp.]